MMLKVHKVRPILTRLYYQHNSKFTVRQNRALIDFALDSIAKTIKAEKKRVKALYREPYHYGWNKCCDYIAKMVRGTK